MAFIGIVVIVIGLSITWLLGISGLQPSQAIDHVRQVIGLPMTNQQAAQIETNAVSAKGAGQG